MLRDHFNWKRLSVAAVVGYAPRDAWLVFGTTPGPLLTVRETPSGRGCLVK